MNEKTFAQLAARFRQEREQLHMTQQEMATLGGVSLRTLQGWESGSYPPKIEFLAQAAQAGVDINYVITGERTSDMQVVARPAIKVPKFGAVVNRASERNVYYQGDAVADVVNQLEVDERAARKLTGPSPAPQTDQDTIYIPLLSATGSMGPGAEAHSADVVMGDVPVSLSWVQMNLPRHRPEALRLVHAYGDSMRGTLESGDFALVDTDVHTVEIDGVYVLEAHHRLFIKRVRQRMDGAYEISSDNPSIKQVDILNGDHEVRICGMVVYGWNGRRF